MSKKTVMKPVAAALGAVFVTSLAGTSVANAAENPFGMTELSSGYQVAEGDMKEGKCGGKMKEEGKMKKEGKCGGMKKGDHDSSDKMKKEGKCGEGKMKKEGKCGEGKCGGKK
ncbi:MAG: hypothetical protein ACE5FQ_08145 [Thiogranum sp.]